MSMFKCCVDDEGSGFSFYFFFYSFAEYVDIDLLYYVIAPGSFHGAEGKWRNGCCVPRFLPRKQCVA